MYAWLLPLCASVALCWLVCVARRLTLAVSAACIKSHFLLRKKVIGLGETQLLTAMEAKEVITEPQLFSRQMQINNQCPLLIGEKRVKTLV